MAAGHSVRALTRRPQDECDGVTWIEGALDSTESLRKLCDGVDAVIHVAGVINAPNAEGFEAGNVTGTLSMLAAATASGVHRFVHVSSLAAREPDLSLYGASKARSEKLVQGSGLDWAIVRPPAVYGPGDRETLELFKMAKRGLVMLPPGGRLSVIHVDDLARLLLALAAPDAPKGLTIEPDDGHPHGYSHREFARTLGRAFDRKVVAISTPSPMVRLGAAVDRLFRGPAAKLTPDRAAYFCHPDWVVSADLAAPSGLWHPSIPTPRGLADTARWYRDHRWL